MNKKHLYIFSAILLLLTVGVSCKKEISKIFEVQTQQVTTTDINKIALKKQIEFISTAYADVFGKSIPADELNNTINCYAGNGDKDLVTDRIIRGYLNRDILVLPSSQQIANNIETFVIDTYNKFYHRVPTEMEKYKMVEMIKNTTKPSAAGIYYSFLTSDEYKYH